MVAFKVPDDPIDHDEHHGDIQTARKGHYLVNSDGAASEPSQKRREPRDSRAEHIENADRGRPQRRGDDIEHCGRLVSGNKAGKESEDYPRYASLVQRVAAPEKENGWRRA